MIVANFSWTGTISLTPGLTYPTDQNVADLTGGEPLLAVFM